MMVGQTIPNVPPGRIADENGNMTADFESFLIQLISYLQTNLSNEGLVPPALSTAQIGLLTGVLNGSIVYNYTTGKLMGKEGGTFQPGYTDGTFTNLI